MRTITVVLEIEDQNSADIIWEKHKKGELLNGCFIIGISNGNLIKERDSNEY